MGGGVTHFNLQGAQWVETENFVTSQDSEGQNILVYISGNFYNEFKKLVWLKPVSFAISEMVKYVSVA